VAVFSDADTNKTAMNASRLIDNGRAGALDRVEEILEFSVSSGYSRIGVAYCFGLKPLAMEFCERLKERGLVPLPVSCTSGAVKEKEVDETKTVETISCNPAGQALVLNRLAPDLVVEMGLCMGHDVIFHSNLKVPHTVLLVKDRVHLHNPVAHFKSFKSRMDNFVETMDSSFCMKTPDWLIEKLAAGVEIQVIDLRARAAFEKGHIPGAVNMTLKELPRRWRELQKDRPVLFACNGSVQSAYGVAYLASLGFSELHNLSGGMSRWEKENKPQAT
jgi:uncharacterized metal-binding protein/rhodanese-related sulfurtransferase